MAKNKKRKIKVLREEKRSEEYYARFGGAEYEIEAREEDLGRPLTQLEINAIRARRKDAPAGQSHLPQYAGAGGPPGRRPQRAPVEPSSEPIAAQPSLMADPEIQITSGAPQTPRLQILKSPAGEYTITYGKTDPLGLRTELNTGLDSEIQRLFGYESWQEYKNQNMADLKKSLKTDESGKVTQAPTVHPFHVAYGLEEFVKNFDVNEYEIVGVPAELWDMEAPTQAPGGGPEEEPAGPEKPEIKEKPGQTFPISPLASPMEENIEKIQERTDIDIMAKQKRDPLTGIKDPKLYSTGRTKKQRKKQQYDLGQIFYMLNVVLKMRKNFFGDPAGGAGSLVHSGILNQAMINPQEKLLNKDVIKRVRQQFDFNEIFNQKFTGNLPVKHPTGKYWKADLTSYNDVTDNLEKILVVSVKNAMKNSSLLKEAEEGQSPDFGTWAQKTAEGWGLELDDSTWTMLQAAWFTIQVGDPTFVSAVPDVVLTTVNLANERTWENLGAVGFSLLAAIPYIGDVAKVGSKADKAVESVDFIANLLKKRGGDMADVGDSLGDASKILKENPNLSAKEVRELADKFSESAEKMREGRAVADSTTKAADRLEAMGDELRSTISPRGEVTIPLINRKYQAGRAATQAVGEVGAAAVQLEPLDPSEQVPAMEPVDTENTGIPASELPNISVSIGKLDFYIVPKNWRKGEWLTVVESVLSQRVGANTKFIKGSTPLSGQKKETPVAEGHYLIFGHSQSSPAAMGGAIINQIMAAGEKFERVTRGVNDVNLAKEIKKIKNKNFTHAFLFLGGNTESADPAYDFKDDKSAIIRHATDVLNISKENIVVVLPPVNRDNEFSKSRIPLHQRAEKYFNSLGVKVLPMVVGNQKDFRDNIHMKNSSLAQEASNNVLALFPKVEATKITDKAEQDKTTIEEPSKSKLSRKQIAKIIVDESNKAGVPPIHSLTMALIEGWDPNDDKGPYYGLYQLSKGEWDEAAVGKDWDKIYDVRENTKAFIYLYKRNRRYLASRGIPVEPWLIYLVHNQGRDGLRQIYNTGTKGQKLIGKNLVGPYAPSDPVKADARAKKIRYYMEGNWFGEGDGGDPQNFLRDWKSRYNQLFLSKAQVLLPGAQSVVSESKLLKQLINIIERVEENELV